MSKAYSEIRSLLPGSVAVAGTVGVFLVVSILGLFFAVALAQEKDQSRLVAHGEYSGVGKKEGRLTSVKMDQWEMYRLENGSYSVFVDMTWKGKQWHIEEHNIVASDLKPEKFGWTILRSNNSMNIIKIQCNFGMSEIVCQSTLNGVSSSATFAGKKPYVFIPAMEGPTLDMPWFYQKYWCAGWPLRWAADRYIHDKH